MNIKLTLGERLKDLRVERDLKLETLAEQTGLSKSALSKYESDDVTDLSIYAVTTLAEFYGVTTDYLLGVTENKKRPDAVLSDLHLSDGAGKKRCCGRMGERTPLVPLQACAGSAETVNCHAHPRILLPQNRCLSEPLAAPFPRQPEPRCNTLDFAKSCAKGVLPLACRLGQVLQNALHFEVATGDPHPFGNPRKMPINCAARPRPVR